MNLLHGGRFFCWVRTDLYCKREKNTMFCNVYSNMSNLQSDLLHGRRSSCGFYAHILCMITGSVNVAVRA